MLTTEQFSQVLQQLDIDRAAAQTNELAELEDKAWTRMLVASRHAGLTKRWEMLASNERNYAQNAAATPGRARAAEESMVRAQNMLEVAQAHREAAEQTLEEAEKLYQEAGAQMAQQRQRNGQQQVTHQQTAPVRPRSAPTPQPQPAVPRRPPASSDDGDGQ